MKKYVMLMVCGLILIAGSWLIFSDHAPKHKQIRHPEFINTPYGGKVKKEPKALPNEWFGYQRAWPQHEIKQSSYLAALDAATRLHQSSANRDYTWELAGPTNVGGRITDIAIHPDYPDVWYVGAATGGIFKTTDAGQSWEHVFTDAPVISIGDIAIDPENPDIIYAGTGEANSSSQSFVGNGMYKSTDAGATWQHIGLEESAYIARVVVDHSNSQRVFAAATGTLFSPNLQRGIYRSDDGGLTWDQKLFVTDSTAAIDIVQHPTDANTLYAAMWERMRGRSYRRSGGPTSGIYKSMDGGDTWTELTNGLPDDEYVGRIGLAIAQSAPSTVYAFYDSHPTSYYSFKGIYKTTDDGASWSQTNDGNITDMNSSFGWYFGQIRVDPADADRAYALGVALCRTQNGGASWQIIADYGNTNEIHVDHHAMVIDQTTGRIVEGNDGGLYTSTDYGNNWTKINDLPLTQFYAIEIDKTNPEKLYGGTQDNSTIRTLTGALDDWEVILGGDGFYCKVDHTNPSTIYAEYQWGALHKSTNNGLYFNNILGPMEPDRKNWSAPLAMHPVDAQTLYFGTYRLWKTTNGGGQWTALTDDITDGPDGSSYHTVSTIEINPTFPNVIIAGTDDGNVHVSSDDGANWTDVTAGLPERWITRVAGDPFDMNTIYVTVSGFRWDEPQPHVFKSENLGQDWVDISGNLPELPVNTIILDPQVPGRIFAGTDAGIFITEDGGTQWNSLSQGLPNVPIIDMRIHDATRTLVIGTYGCSAYKLNLDDLTTVDPHGTPAVSAQLKQNYPNPFTVSGAARSGGTTIEYSLSEPTDNVSLEIFNLKGQLVKTIRKTDGQLQRGSFVWDGTDTAGAVVASGTYLYRLKADEKPMAVRKITVLK
jgi:photosystem II stability/assembly factor-like uncharacterized protein